MTARKRTPHALYRRVTSSAVGVYAGGRTTVGWISVAELTGQTVGPLGVAVNPDLPFQGDPKADQHGRNIRAHSACACRALGTHSHSIPRGAYAPWSRRYPGGGSGRSLWSESLSDLHKFRQDSLKSPSACGGLFG